MKRINIMSLISRIIIILTIGFHFQNAYAQSAIAMRTIDKLRIKEAVTVSKLCGENIWKGINEIPFTIILLTDSIEFLIYHPYPSADFILSERDTILNTDIFYRKRQYPKHFLATFPAVNGVSCIVVGTPENTGRSSTNWIITLLHEHFHQYEYSYPGYFQGVEELGLSGGDKTGMWMLDYNFPYDSIPVIDQYKKYSLALSDLLTGIDSKNFKFLFKKYKKERIRLKGILTPADYSYLSFQIWQEGIALYTEYKFLELPDNYKPSKEIAALPDFISFSDYKKQLYELQIKSLAGLKLNEEKRVCFYSIGFAEGLLLDRLNKEWHSVFLKQKFYIEQYSSKF